MVKLKIHKITTLVLETVSDVLTLSVYRHEGEVKEYTFYLEENNIVIESDVDESLSSGLLRVIYQWGKEYRILIIK